MIVWRGWGILSIVIALAAVAAAQMTTPLLPASSWTFRWHAAVALLVGAGVNFWAGWRLNRRGRLVVDPTTGQTFQVVRGRHDLFFIPMEYWSVVFVLGAAVALFAR